MIIPDDLLYTESHEWIKREGENIRVGITDHAQAALGDLVYIDLPKAGRRVEAGEACAVAKAKSPTEAFTRLKGMVPSAVVTDGPNGAFIRYGGKEAHVPAFPCEQPAFGATPPTVLTRWMLVTRLNAPCGPTDFAPSRSHGMSPAFGASARSTSLATTLLPSAASQCGPA